MELLDILFRSIFIGFVIWTFIWMLAKKEHWFGYRTADIDRMAVVLVIVFGMVHLFMLAFNAVEYTKGISLNEAWAARAFGPYWLGFWIYPLTYVGLTQLFWMENIRSSRFARMAIALWIFAVMHFEKWVIIATTLQRDYIPGEKSFPALMFLHLGISWLTSIGIFMVIIITALGFRKPARVS